MVKLHVAPLGGDIVWVSAHSAISEACTACKATDLSQLPFFKAAALAGALQEVCNRGGCTVSVQEGGFEDQRPDTPA